MLGLLSGYTDVAVKSGSGNPELFGNRADRDVSRSKQSTDRLEILRRQFPRPAALAPASTSRSEAGHSAFSDQLA
jgi:hypothetical protein